MQPIKGFGDKYAIAEDGVVINTQTQRVLKHSLNENGYRYVHFWHDGKQHSRSVHRLVAEAYLPNPDGKPVVNHLDANRSNAHKDNLEWCTQSENVHHAYHIGTKSQKKHFMDEELDWLLTRFLERTTMTELAECMGVGLTRLSINLRNHAIKSARQGAFEQELSNQKRERNTATNAKKRKPVRQFSKTGELIAEFPSAAAAARALGRSSSGTIHNTLNPDNPQKSAYGYLWKYT